MKVDEINKQKDQLKNQIKDVIQNQITSGDDTDDLAFLILALDEYVRDLKRNFKEDNDETPYQFLRQE